MRLCPDSVFTNNVGVSFGTVWLAACDIRATSNDTASIACSANNVPDVDKASLARSILLDDETELVNCKQLPIYS